MKRMITSSALAALFVALTATSASAHITAAPDKTGAGDYSFVRFGVPHGCEEAGTTSFTIKIPQEDYVFTSVTPFISPNWDVEAKRGELKEETEVHGQKVTEGIHEITYTKRGEPLPAHQGDAVHVSIRLPEDAAGETLYFPVVQKCEGGKQTGWIQVPGEGESAEELSEPAPSILVTEGGGGHGEAKVELAAAGTPDMSRYVTDEHVHSHTNKLYTLSIAALVIGLTSLVWSLLRGRKRNDA